MDFKKILPFMLLAMAIIVLWQPFMLWVAKKQGWETAAERTRLSSTQPTTAEVLGLPTTDPAATSPSSVNPLTDPTTSTSATLTTAPASAPAIGRYKIIESAPAPTTTVMGTRDTESLDIKQRRDSLWAMSLSLTSQGAGVEKVELSDYRKDLREKIPYTFATGELGFEPFTRPLSTRVAIIDGTRVDLTNANWVIKESSLDASATQHTLRYELTIARDGVAAVRIAKTYTLFNRQVKLPDIDAGPMGYEALLRYTVDNLTGAPITIALLTNGPNSPPAESERMPDRQIIGGYDIGNGHVRIEHKYTDSIVEPSWEVTKHPSDYKFLWVTGSTVYFNSMVRPEPLSGSYADWVESVKAFTLTPTLFGADRAVGTIIQTKPMTVEPGKSLTLGFSTYFGPRKREYLHNAFYSRPFMEYGASLVIAAWPCGFCTFTWLIDILFGILKSFHFVLRDWGLSIIALVVLVRTLLHPITKRSQLSMMKMGKLGPEIEKLRKKYGDNKEELNKAMVQFYRTQGATPILGCLPMFLQMPIWIALWQALQTTFDLRHAPAFYGLTWIQDLSKPDHLINFADFGWKALHVPLLPFTTISGLNILPLLMGIIMYWQIKIQPKPLSMSPEQQQQQKIVQWMMIIMMPIFLYGSPSGLCLYIITSTLLGIWETKIVRRQYEAQEAEAAKFQIVEGEVVTASAGTSKVAATRSAVRTSDRKRPEGKIAGFFYDMNLKAEKMRQQLDKQQGENSRKKKK